MGTLKSNWAGNIAFNQKEVAYPKTEKEIQNVVLKAANSNKKIRTIGSGHSFTALCTTDNVLLSLDNYQGLIYVDKEKNIATVKAGTKLKALGEILFQEGLAMENLGDIDTQSIAGTISTGTHGTGTRFGTISTQVLALKFVNGKGEIVKCSRTNNPELFKACQVSLGAFGVITEVTLQCVPAYKLLIDNKKERIDDVMATINDRNSSNRNFEFFWIPYTNVAWTKSTNEIEEGEPDKDSYMNYLSELIVENYSFQALCELAKRIPCLNQFVANMVAGSVPTMKKINYSHRVYATLRMVRFKEMEYNVPAETFQDVIKDIRKVMNKKKFKIHFPVENRWVKGDDIMMSPAYGRDSAYIAVHAYHKKDHKPYFHAIEEVFKAYDGRPHWGKQNTFSVTDVEASYPMFSIFSKHRKEHDPNRIFTNPYLAKLIG